VILVVVADPADRARVEGELRRRVGADYEIAVRADAAGGREALRALADEGREVAIVLAAHRLPGGTGADLLGEVAALHPQARRGLLVTFGAWGDPAVSQAILQGIAAGRFDYYVLTPWRTPDELFNRTVAEFLHDWSRSRRGDEREVTVVGPAWSPRAHDLRDMLTRSGIPHRFLAADDPAAAPVLATCRAPEGSLVVRFQPSGRVLVDPTATDVARAFGLVTDLPGHDWDVVIVGAGPAGLAAAVYGASEGMRTLVVERQAIGGQAGSSSMIRNYLGFARGIGGAELTQRAYQQAWVFGATFLMTREVTALTPGGDRHRLRLAGGEEVSARAVILAVGVSYRRLGIPVLDELTGAGVFYGASASEAQALAGQDVYLVGGGNSAGQAAVHLARYARSVTIAVRGATLADSMSRYLIDQIEATPVIRVLHRHRVTGGGAEGGRLAYLDLEGPDGTRRVPAAGLFVLIGAAPHTAWLPGEVARDPWGYVLTGGDLGPEHLGAFDGHPPRPLETSVPGVFAAGDVRHASVKRVAASVGDGAIAIKEAQEHLDARAALAGAVARPAG